MTLLHLRYFCTVVECGNLSKAAAKLFISQPALSKMIKALEDELGAQLFDRQGRQVRLNSEGVFFYENVTRSLSTLDYAVQAFTKQPALKEIHISVFAADLLMEDVVADYQRIHEDVFFVWHGESGSDGAATHVDDLMVYSVTDGQPPVPSPYTHVLLTERFGLILPTDDPLAAQPSIDLLEVKDRRFLGTSTQGVNHRMCHAAGFSPHIVCMGQNVHTYIKLLACRNMVSIAPEVTIGRYLPKGCVFVPLSNPQRSRTILIQENSLRTPRPHVREFLQYCIYKAQKLTGG